MNTNIFSRVLLIIVVTLLPFTLAVNIFITFSTSQGLDLPVIDTTNTYFGIKSFYTLSEEFNNVCGGYLSDFRKLLTDLSSQGTKVLNNFLNGTYWSNDPSAVSHTDTIQDFFRYWGEFFNLIGTLLKVAFAFIMIPFTPVIAGLYVVSRAFTGAYNVPLPTGYNYTMPTWEQILQSWSNIFRPVIV